MSVRLSTLSGTPASSDVTAVALALTTRRAIALVLALSFCASCGGESFHVSRGEADAPGSQMAAAMATGGATRADPE